MIDLERWQALATRLQADHDHACRAVVDETQAFAKASNDLVCAQEAQKVLQAAAEEVQRQAHARIAGVVTRCLHAVFGLGAYSFDVTFAQKRGRTEAQLSFVRDGQKLDPLSGAGGGAVDVASFALRMAALMLTRPRARRCLFLDESFKHVSHQYRPRVRELLETLAEEMNTQIMMVTHSRQLRAGKVIELE